MLQGLLWLVLDWAGGSLAWLDSRSLALCLFCALVTGTGDLLYLRGLQNSDGVALPAPALLLPAIAVLLMSLLNRDSGDTLGAAIRCGVALLAAGNGLLLLRRRLP